MAPWIATLWIPRFWTTAFLSQKPWWFTMISHDVPWYSLYGFIMFGEILARVPGWWYTYPSEKYEFVRWDYYSQYMESHKKSSKPPTRYTSFFDPQSFIGEFLSTPARTLRDPRSNNLKPVPSQSPGGVPKKVRKLAKSRERSVKLWSFIF